MKNRTWIMGIFATAGLMSHVAEAGTAAALRVGTFGYGLDFDVGITETLNLRLGYNGFNLSRTIDDTDVRYDGKLKISSASAIIDWHAFHGGFHLSLGAVSKGPKIDVTGTPTGGTYEINDHTYTAAQVGSLSGTVKMGDSIAPYIGIGWGNTVDKGNRFTFLFDLGVIHTGSPKATLNVTCGAGVPTNVCDQIRSDVAAEKVDLENEVDSYKWYPVVALGVGIRF